MNDAVKSSVAETWRERIISQQAAGQSIRALCKQNGWHEHAFYWWRSRLGLSPGSVVRRRRKRIVQAGFAEVLVDGPVVEVPGVRVPVAGINAEPILLRLASGRELVLPVSITDERLASLVHLIEGKPSTVEGRS